MTALLRRLATSEDGAVTVEVALYLPAAVLAVCLVWAFGATVNTASAMLHTAVDAARAASHAPTAARARADAASVARQVLAEHHLRCHDITVTVDTAGFTVPVGQPAQVSVDVTCRITLADLYVPGLPGEKTLHEHQTSPLDTFRTRQ